MYSIEEFDKQKIKVLKYILYQKRCEQEIKTKFIRSIEETMLEDIIEYLKEAGYINDEEYIQRTVAQWMNLKNLSTKELTYKLYAKGLSKGLIENYIDKHEQEIQEYEKTSATNIIEKKKSTMENEEIKRYLLKKGYRSENVKIGEE